MAKGDFVGGGLGFRLVSEPIRLVQRVRLVAGRLLLGLRLAGE